MNVVSWGHSLIQETSDSIDEVRRCQDQKVELSCFFSDRAYPLEFSWRHHARSPLFQICLSRYHTFLAKPRSLPLSTSLTFHGLMEIRPFLIRTDRIVQPLDLKQKVPPLHALGGRGKIQ